MICLPRLGIWNMSNNMKLMAVLVICFSAVVNMQSDEEKWKEYKEKFNKTYDTSDEDSMRFQYFQEILQAIDQHNALFEKGDVTWTMGITRFADQPPETVLPTRNSTKKIISKPERKASNLPPYVDWRDANATLPPLNMTSIDQSWAFAHSAIVELALYLYNGTAELMSPQYLIDCTSVYTVFGAFYHGFLTGTTSDFLYPYTGEKANCKWAPGRVFTQYKYINTTENKLKEIIVQNGSIAVSIDGTNLFLYDTGIIGGSDCENEESKYKTPWNVAIVGYGTENGTDYWLMKNSLGPMWGEEGYFRLQMNVNACGLLNEMWSAFVTGVTKIVRVV
ncbi:hypothetical protein JTB14_007552 [Gonioctena quinquepunctata]|nr:hypothetical protein JTB14_007552 [Gonioctena quinquepunctata]